MSDPEDAQISLCDARRAVDQQVSFVLSPPGMSTWLKNALSGALDRHPIEVLNDLEILDLILRNRSELLIAEEHHQ